MKKIVQYFFQEQNEKHGILMREIVKERKVLVYNLEQED